MRGDRFRSYSELEDKLVSIEIFEWECLIMLNASKFGFAFKNKLSYYYNDKTFGRALDLRANGAWLSKLTE